MASPNEGFARVPLLARLVDARPDEMSENPPVRMLDAAGLQNSVADELRRLLNTRRATGRETDLTVLDYGIPDWTGLYANNSDDRLRIERGIVRAILAFEPRLREPQAKVEPIPDQDQILQVYLYGKLHNDKEAWPVLFSISFKNGHAVLQHDRGRPA